MGKHLDREYLEDYEEKQYEEYNRLVNRRIQEGTFDFEKDRFPPDEHFINLQKPVAGASPDCASWKNIWAQVPFSGSLIISIPSLPRPLFEKHYFKISEITKIIDFVKETGRLQVALKDSPKMYEGVDYLDPFFKELEPPPITAIPVSIFGSKKELQRAHVSFTTLGKIRFFPFLSKEAARIAPHVYKVIAYKFADTYAFLKLGRYTIVEEIENLLVDDPIRAGEILSMSALFIEYPVTNLRFDLRNFTLNEARGAQLLPPIYQPNKIRFPCEIGKFLLKKLTCAPQGIRACYDIIDHYNSYNLQTVQKSLNEAIVTNHPDIVNKSVEEFSEILDNVWKDKTILKRIENIKVGVPISIAAIGGIAGGLIGGLAGIGTGGFLAELGFRVGEKAVEKFFSVKGEGLSEGIAKLRTKSYQANVYDFKKKYDLK